VKKLLVLGAGTAGTIVVNKLRPRLDADDWDITIVDQNKTHYYQPGFLFIPFGIYKAGEVERPKMDFIAPGINTVFGEIELIEPADNKVKMADGQVLDYDYLVIATGTHPRPDQTPGFEDGLGGDVHEFYTLEGAVALAEKLRTRSPRWSSPSWPTGGSRSKGSGTRSI